MKILMTCISLSRQRGGGVAQRTRHLARHLKQLGEDPRVLVMHDGSLVGDLVEASIPVIATGAIRIRFDLPFLNPHRLTSLVREADVLHILGYWNLLSVAVASIARGLGRPYVLSGAGEFAALASPRVDQRIFHRVFGTRMIAGAASIIAVTDLEREQIVGLLGIDPARVVVIPNGVDVSTRLGPGSDRLPTEPSVLFLGRLAKIKGPDLLLEAFGRIADEHSEIKLVLAGPDFGMRAALQGRARALGIASRVLFPGFLDEAERENAYARATLLAIPSRAEAMSLVALEAGAAGTPVLLTDQCGFNEVQSARGGKVVPATVEGLEEGLRDLLGSRPDLPTMGRNLQRFVLDRYGWPNIVAQLIQHLTLHLRH